MRTVAAVRGIEKLSAAGLSALVQVADAVGTDPDNIATVISFESGFDKHAVNPYSGAYSFIQFMPSTLGRLGTDKARVALMSDVEILRGPVFAYFAPFKGRLATLDDTYLAVFFPAAMGKADDWVVARQGDGSQVYEQNKGFDRGAKGYITKGDIVQTIRGVRAAAEGKPRIPVADVALAGFSTLLLLMGVIGATAGATWYALSRGL